MVLQPHWQKCPCEQTFTDLLRFYTTGFETRSVRIPLWLLHKYSMNFAQTICIPELKVMHLDVMLQVEFLAVCGVSEFHLEYAHPSCLRGG